MRPQFERRARRAAAALGALALGVGISGTVATAAALPGAPANRPPQAPPALAAAAGAAAAPERARRPRRGAHRRADAPASAHRSIAVQERRGRAGWPSPTRRPTAHGHFLERFWPRRLGRCTLRLYAAGLTAAHTTLVGRVATVYHQVVASWYGRRGMTACGEALGAGTLGVANRTLPCGTMVTPALRRPHACGCR